jgi:dTDP-4-amino-4,6-dideoxygalactose transaminase
MPPISVPMINLRAQYESIRSDVENVLLDLFNTQCFVLGPHLRSLEEKIAVYCGSRFGVGVASGTDALTLSLRALGVGSGDEVIVPSFSFFATAESVILAGATPVYADVDPQTLTLAPESMARKISARTRAVIPVHLYGQSADMDPIMMLARDHRLFVVEDNAQAIGATYKGKRTGTIGDAGCISFYPTKNLGAWGDAGMIITDSDTLAAHLLSLRNHGQTGRYISSEVGYNSRLDEIQAAVVEVKLKYLDLWQQRRCSHAATYDRMLGNVPGISLLNRRVWGDDIFHQYTIRVANRSILQDQLARRGIETAIYYPLPLHLQPAFASGEQVELPNSEQASEEALSIPIFAELTHDEVEYVALSITEIMNY